MSETPISSEPASGSSAAPVVSPASTASPSSPSPMSVLGQKTALGLPTEPRPSSLASSESSSEEVAGAAVQPRAKRKQRLKKVQRNSRPLSRLKWRNITNQPEDSGNSGSGSDTSNSLKSDDWINLCVMSSTDSASSRDSGSFSSRSADLGDRSRSRSRYRLRRRRCKRKPSVGRYSSDSSIDLWYSLALSNKSTCSESSDTTTPQPVFSETWQFSEEFSVKGGHLKGTDSDVILSIPENAITGHTSEDEFLFICLRPNAFINRNSQDQFRHESSELAASGGLVIHGAISTDLEIIHEKLCLGKDEVVSSPVVEYSAGSDLTFQQPVCISLPHFLPPDFNPADVRVYQFHKDEDENIRVKLLIPMTASSNENAHESMACGTQYGFTNDELRRIGMFYFSDEHYIQILTFHFSGYFCTFCRQTMDPPHLRLRLYGKHMQRETQDVDLTLFIWDLRLNIRDFRKAGLPNPDEEQHCQATQTLEPLRTQHVADTELGVCLQLPKREETIWMHQLDECGLPFQSPERRISLQSFVPCCVDTIPKRVDWALLTRDDPGQLRWFECFVKVGYVKASTHSDDETLQFLQTPRAETLQIRGLELVNEQKEEATQTDLTENSHVKQLDEAKAFPLISPTEVDVSNNACTPPLARAAEPESSVSASSGNTLPPSCPSSCMCRQKISMALQPNANGVDTPLQPCPGSPNCQQMSAMALQPSASAAAVVALASTHNNHMGSSSGPVYQNCTFNMHSNTNTHNTNVKHMNKMNTGNTRSTLVGEIARAIGPPPPNTPQIQLPDEEELIQGSLRQAQCQTPHVEIYVEEAV